MGVGLVAAGVLLFSQRKHEREIEITEREDERAELLEMKQSLTMTTPV